MSWESVAPGLFLFRDSCNVYALEGPEGMLIVNAGTGRWLRNLDDLPKPPAALACTHYFRDHAAGALPAAEQGIAIHVPEYEYEKFADPAEHFRRRETYIIYDNLWNLNVPIEGVPVAGVLRDYETVRLAGLEVTVVPLPGATLTQIGLQVEIEGNRRAIFCGEAIHSPGRVPRVAPYQYNYNDFSGGLNAYLSAQDLRDRKADLLLPSLGDPILEEPDHALAQLQENLRRICSVRAGMAGMFDAPHDGELEKVTDHIWRDAQSSSHNWFIVSDSGKAMVIDYGYRAGGPASPGYASPPNRRPLLHGLKALKKQFGIDRIDMVLVSHFHDDHVCGIPLLQRLYGTQVWAPDNFAELIEKPEAHCFPCTWPQPIPVDRKIRLDETVSWEEYRFHFAPMSGHTRFAALIGFEADGKRIAHTGDQYFLNGDFADWSQCTRMQNHVYRNGALLDGYEQSSSWLLDWRPDVVLQGHQTAFFTDETFFEHISQWNEDYRAAHEQVMPLAADATHFNLDSWGGWIWPYRTHIPDPKPVEVTVTVRNPFPHPAALELSLVGPRDWKGESTKLDAEPRAEVSCTLSITPSGECRRQPFAVDLVANGQPFGQVAEALVTVGGSLF